jgi:hypothetical protein
MSYPRSFWVLKTPGNSPRSRSATTTRGACPFQHRGMTINNSTVSTSTSQPYPHVIHPSFSPSLSLCLHLHPSLSPSLHPFLHPFLHPYHMPAFPSFSPSHPSSYHTYNNPARPSTTAITPPTGISSGAAAPAFDDPKPDAVATVAVASLAPVADEGAVVGAAEGVPAVFHTLARDALAALRCLHRTCISCLSFLFSLPPSPLRSSPSAPPAHTRATIQTKTKTQLY